MSNSLLFGIFIFMTIDRVSSSLTAFSNNSFLAVFSDHDHFCA